MSRSTTSRRKIKAAIVTEIISPYRIPVFNCLASDPRIDLEVLFLSETDSMRSWRIPRERIKFSYRVLSGVLIGRSHSGFPLFFNPGMVWQLITSKYDCLVLGGYQHPSNWIALAYARFLRKRCLIWSESTLKDRRSPFPPKEWFKRLIIRQASGYIAAGKAQWEYWVHLGVLPDLIWTAPDAVDVEFFSQAAASLRENKEDLKARLGLNGLALLYVGRLVDVKGIMKLLEAFELVSRRRNDVNLVLVGDGPDRKKYEQYCRRRELHGVLFTGNKEQEELPTYYAIADVFLFPTLTDPWGLALNEAMSAGLPLICSRAAGAADDLVMHGENGLLHNPLDSEELAEQFVQLLDDEQLRRRMGERFSTNHK